MNRIIKEFAESFDSIDKITKYMSDPNNLINMNPLDVFAFIKAANQLGDISKQMVIKYMIVEQLHNATMEDE